MKRKGPTLIERQMQRIAANMTARRPAPKPAKRKKRRAKAAPVEPTPAPPPNLTVLDGGKKRLVVTDELVARARARLPRNPVERRDKASIANPFRFPEFPKQVLDSVEKSLAMDNALAGIVDYAASAWQGQYLYGSAFFEGMTFLGYTYLAELAQRPEYRKISERIASDMTRKWIKLQSTGDEESEGTKSDRIKAIEDELTRLSAQDKFRELAEQDGFFGRAHLFFDMGDEGAELASSIGDGRSPATAIKVTKAHPLRAIRTVEPIWCYPMQYNSNNPLAPDWYKPQVWNVMGQNVHRSRIVPFVGREVPDMLKPAYAFGGLALSQMAKPYVDNWLRTRQSVSDLIHAFSINGLKTNMDQTLTPEGNALFNRIDLFNLMRDNRGAFVIDKNTEEWFQFNTPLGTLDALQAQAQEQMASVVSIPLVILLGISPHGLNASSEGEIRIYYDWIEAYQEKLFRAPLTTLIDFVQLSIFGNIDPQVTFQFEPLWSMTEKEQSEVDKNHAEADKTRIDSGVLHPVEVRQRLAADPASPYPELDVDDVPEPPMADGEGGPGAPGPGGPGGNPSNGPGDPGDDLGDDPGDDENQHGPEGETLRDPLGRAFLRQEGQDEGPRHERDRMSEEDLKGSVQRVVDIPDEAIRETVKQSGGKESLADKLIARKQDMAKRFGVKPSKAADEAPFDESKHKRDKDGKFASGSGGGGGGASAESDKPEPGKTAPAFGGLYKFIGSNAKENHDATVKSVIEKPVQKGIHYRRMLKHLIKEAGKHGTSDGSINELKGKLAAALAKAAVKAEKIAIAQPDKAAAMNAIAEKAKAAQAKLTASPAATAETAAEYEVKKVMSQQGAGLYEVLDALTVEQKAELDQKYGSIGGAIKKLTGASAAAKPAPAPAPAAEPTGYSGFSQTANMINANGHYSHLTKAKEIVKAGVQAGMPYQTILKTLSKVQADQLAANYGTIPTAYQKSVAYHQQAKQQAQQVATQAAQEAAQKQSEKDELHAYAKELGVADADAAAFQGLAQMMGLSPKNAKAKLASFESRAKQAGMKDLHGFEAAMLAAYTGSAYGRVNKALRNGTWTAQQHVYVNTVNKALKKLPPYEGVTRRGTTLNKTDQAKYVVGNVTEERAFTSTSTGSGFDGNTRYTITGKSGRDISKISNYQHEGEVLFPARTFFRVTKVEGQPGGDMHVHMEEVEVW